MNEPVPLSPAVFHILLALAGGAKHGYAIMQDVAEQTGERLLMGPGTLYGCLKRMLAAGLVAECASAGGEEDDDERRRYYRLTSAGSKAVNAEAERLADALRAARARGVTRKGVAV